MIVDVPRACRMVLVSRDTRASRIERLDYPNIIVNTQEEWQKLALWL